MVKYCLEDFFRSKLPIHVFAKKNYFLTAQEQACNRLTCLFGFWICNHASYQLQKTPWKPSLKALLALVETIGRRFSFLFATHLLLEHLSAQLDTAATAHSALRHNVRVLQAYLVKKTFSKWSFIYILKTFTQGDLLTNYIWNPTLLICRCTL